MFQLIIVTTVLYDVLLWFVMPDVIYNLDLKVSCRPIVQGSVNSCADMNAVSTHAQTVYGAECQSHTLRTGIVSLLSHYRPQFAYELVCQRNNSGITKPDIYHKSLWPATLTIQSLSPIGTFQGLTVLWLL